MMLFWQDIRYGVRSLIKKPGFAAVVVLTLGLGIGANTAIFGFLDRILLRPLPVKNPHELVLVKYRYKQNSTGSVFSYPFYRGLREQSEDMFSGLIAHTAGKMKLRVGEMGRKVCAVYVSGNYFSVLGVEPAIGRGFLYEEDQIAVDHPVVVISYGLWQRQFHSDPNVLGKTIRLDDYPLTVVGVAPREFTGTFAGVGPSVYVPLKKRAEIDGFSLEEPKYTWLLLLGRLKPGMSHRQAQAVLRVAAGRLHAIHSDKPNFPTEMLVADGSRGKGAGESLWRPFALLQVVTALILLIACANVANMLLARGIARKKEIAIRRAMGAGRGGIVRQLLTEGALLAILSGVSGILVAHWLSIALRSALTEASALNTPVGIDERILVFALLTSLGSGLLFGLIPALQISRHDPIAVIKDDAGAITMLGRRRNLRDSLVVVQIAVSVIALAFGGLCIRSLLKLRFGDLGFDASRVRGVSVNFGHERTKGFDQHQFFVDLKERVLTFPEVQAASLAAAVPFSPRGNNKASLEYIENFQIPSDPNFNNSWLFDHVGPGYFQTLGVPFLRGRDFSVRDGPGKAKVAIVNELLARRFWPDQEAIGKRVKFSGGEMREVVGVVRAAKLYSLRVEPVPTVFLPIAQPKDTKGFSAAIRAAWRVKPVLLVRTKGKPKTAISLLRSELDSAGLDPTACDIRTCAEYAQPVLAEKLRIIGILNIIGSVGLLFVATGVFSVMAFEMGRRTREIGVRMALGAQRADVRRLILRKGALLTGVGLGFGVSFCLIPLRFVIHLLPYIRGRYGDLLYGVHIWDPLTYAGVALLVAIFAMAACWLPAHRAAKIGPMEALRYE